MNTSKRNTDAIILAGGRGTRMKANEKNKVMYEVGGKPLIEYPVQALHGMGIDQPIIVVGFARESIQNYLKDRVRYAIQEQALGTADAVRVAIPHVKKDATDVIVLYGDHSTFYTSTLLQKLLLYHQHANAAMTLITTHLDPPTGYGRILRDASGKMIGIVEEKNATEEQRNIREISTGNAVYSMAFLDKYLPQIEINAISGEYYFTDIVELGVKNSEKIETYVVNDKLVGLGVNTPEQLAEAEEEMKHVCATA